MSATAAQDLPDPLRFEPGAYDVAEFTAFLVTMSAELKVAIDEYLAGWLHRTEDTRQFGLPASAEGRIVVAHEPPRFTHPGAQLAPELDDIDLTKLHDLIRDGVTGLRQLADAVDRTPRHVRWAIAAHPAPSGRLVSPIDWTSELARLPAPTRAWTVPIAPDPSWSDQWLTDLRETERLGAVRAASGEARAS